MSKTEMIIITLSILYSFNILGAIFSWVVLYTGLLKNLRLQTKKYVPNIFFQRLPLVLLNIIIFTAFTIISFIFFGDYFVTTLPSWNVLLFQSLFIIFIDDLWFYFAHRLLHENNFLMRKIHSVHHRALTPFPLEYLYVHPVEWMLGSLGAVLAMLLLFTFMPLYIHAFWVYGIFRNLHELDIHSNLRSHITNKIPFLSVTERHDLHHRKSNGNYASTFDIWDRVFGTSLKK